jgi:hypothetical protein
MEPLTLFLCHLDRREKSCHVGNSHTFSNRFTYKHSCLNVITDKELPCEIKYRVLRQP